MSLGEIRKVHWTFVAPGTPAPGGTDEELAVPAQTLNDVLQQPPRGRGDGQSRALARFARRLSRISNAADAHGLILRTIARTCRARIGALATYSEEQGALVVSATHGYPAVLAEHLRIVPGEGIFGTAFVSGRAELCEAPSPGRPRYRTRSYMVVPLRGPRGPVGILALTDRQGDAAFTPEDLATARGLAAVAELSLAHQTTLARLNDLRRLAAIDPVTGLYNRRHFDERLRGEVERAHRHQQSLVLLLVDLDAFKEVNDTFGHSEGDRMLRSAADCIREGVRVFDLCARYGGDEFAILMPRATIDEAARVAERVRHRVERRFQGERQPITISVGAATLAPGGSPLDLVDEADRRLRAAKRKGKNLVEAGGLAPTY